MSGASPSAAVGTVLHLRRATGRTGHSALRPAPDCEVVNAVVRIREVDDCFLQALRFAHGLVLHEQTVAEMRGGVNYIIAKDFTG